MNKKIIVSHFVLGKGRGGDYGRLLLESLRSQDIETFYTESLLEMLDNHFRPRVDIVDFHWPEYRLARNTLASIGYAIELGKSFIKILLLKIKGVRLCWTVHNHKPHDDRFPILNFLSFLVLAYLMDAVIVMTEWQKNAFIRRFGFWNTKKIRLIPLPNFISWYADTISREDARNKLGIAENAFVYLMFGNVKKYKGIPEALDIYKNIRERNDRFIVAGLVKDPPLKSKIEKNSDGTVLLHLEKIPEEDVACFFRAADVCVFPFQEITNSASLLLAMSMGCPVICRKSGSLQEIVKPSFGILYEGSCLDKALKEIKVRDRVQMGLAALEEARHYDRNETAQKYRETYEWLLK